MPNPVPDAPRVIFDSSALGQAVGQCDCSDCNCACAETTAVALQRRPALGFNSRLSVRRNPESTSLPLDSEHTLFYGPFHYPAVLNRPAQRLLERCDANVSVFGGWLQQESSQGASYQAVEQLLNAGLLLPADQPSPTLPSEATMLAGWIHVTDECNLRCDYCYLPHRNQTISTATGFAVVDAILRSACVHGYQRVKLKYGGGEPLLHLPRIGEIHRYALRQAERTNHAVEGIVLSNGTLLTPVIVQQLLALELRLMVSLDGLGGAHDAQRHYMNGAGSFKKVEKGILTALAYGLVPDISVTVSGKNAVGLPELVSWILEHNLPFSLNFYRENEFSAARADLRLEQDSIINCLQAVYKVIEGNLPLRSMLGALADRADLSRPHLRTCGVGKHYLAFDVNGQAAKCQMQLLHSVTSVHTDDPLAVVRADTREVRNLSVEEKDGCRSCEWKYWCTGGCPLITHRATGQYDSRSPYCSIYRAIFPVIMRLEGLRLLKYGSAC